MRLFSTVGELAGRRRLTMDLPSASSVADLLRMVEGLPGWKTAGESPEYAWRHGSSDFTLAVNGHHVGSRDWGEKRLSEGDEVWLQPPIAGG